MDSYLLTGARGGRVKTPRRLICLALSAIAWIPAQAQEVRINEFMAANATALFDQDGDSSDWIELYNAGPGAADLAGWHLTDSRSTPAKWRFPAATIAEGGYLIVFASGKDRAVAGAQLHTNFKLDSDGEYLALVKPDGLTVVHEFAPAFPRQVRDVSYGAATEATVLVGENTPLDALVPADEAYGTAWTGPEFVPAAPWLAGVPGAPGFEAEGTEPILPEPLGFWELDGDFTDAAGRNHGVFGGGAPVFAGGCDGTPAGAIALDGLDDRIAIPAGNGFPVFNRPAYTVALWVNGLPQPDYRVYCEASTTNNSPLFTIGTEMNGARGTVDIYLRTDAGTTLINHVNSTATAFDGTWHHIAWVDANGQGALYIDGVRDPAAFKYSKTPLSLNTAAIGCVLRAAPSHWFKGRIDRVGVWETALTDEEIAHLAGGASPGAGAYTALIGTDLAAAMHGVNASAYLRWPFSIPTPLGVDALELSIVYNDGFVAYLNGQEVARRNAPAELAWNSRATAAVPRSQSLRAEAINITAAIGALRPGLNVLAIHGLNVEDDDPDFIIAPVLRAASAAWGWRYFPEPSPGAANSGGVEGFAAGAVFSVARGFYDAPFTVALSTATPGAAIRYTTDCSTPSPTHGTIYEGPISIARTTCLRAIAYRSDLLPAKVETHTYVFPDNVATQTGAGFPANWGAHPLVYAVYPEVTTNPRYAATLAGDIRSVPALSIAMPVADLFDGATGIYPNATLTGAAWERGCSAELIYPDNRAGFNVNCGISMHGGSSRNWTSTPKHSFRLYFRGAYGPSKLRRPLFGPAGAREFNQLVLRACYTDTWTSRYMEPRYRPDRAQYLRDQWMRDAQIAAGGVACRGLYVSLFVDGLYWGLYNVAEHIDASFCAAHLGGAAEEYDVIKDLTELRSGTWTAWNTMFAMANAGLASDAAYRQIQEYLHLDSFIDYIILHLYGGAEDWPHHNWGAGRRRAPGEGFRFFTWDQEIVLDVLDRDYSEKDYDKSPARLHQRLRANLEYRLRFADRVQRLLFNGGVLSPEGGADLYRGLAATIDRAVVGESAKWAGYRAALQTPPIPAYTRDIEWVTWRDWTLNHFFPFRTALVLNQFRADGLYPAVKAPEFNRHGGRVEPGFRLRIANPHGSGRVLYTLDGNDVRVGVTGEVAPGALEYSGAVTLARSTLVRARVLDGTAWSACAEAQFRLARAEDALRVTEIMYNPLPDGDLDGDSYEFLEIKNTGAGPVDLSGVRLEGGIEYEFSEGTVAEAGAFMVLAIDAAAFAARYPRVPLAGVYRRNLANSGDAFALVAADGERLQEIAFSDAWPWPAEADGKGHSLVPVDVDSPGDPSQAAYWRASLALGGSPGRDDVEIPGGGQIPGDFNQDGKINIADVVGVLGYLFGGKVDTLPCEGGAGHGEGNLIVLDFNGDGRLDISDAVACLRFLFANGRAHARGAACVSVPGCPDACMP